MITKFKKINPNATIPTYQTSMASGMDLHACIETPMIVPSGGVAVIPTGLGIELANGMEGQVRPRSGLAMKYGLTVLNSPGTIDQDFRGELKVILINHGAEDYEISPNERIAQLIVSPVYQVIPMLVEELGYTQRGNGGFGSTGNG